jgi:hypothetical protein
MMHKV